MEVPTDHRSFSSSDFSVPIINVHADNFKSLWPSILLAVRGSTFLALDTEMSGLGDRKSLVAKCVDERYKSMSNAAKSRSILSLGLSCFKLQHVKPAEQTGKWKHISEDGPHKTQKANEWNYVVQTYDIALLCFDEYVVEPKSMQFLTGHGFDFNRQFSKGSQYYRGNDRDHPDISRPSVRDLFSEILLSNVPIVLHNGIIDLVFLHQNLYCDLPSKFSSFVSNLSEMFSAGIFDTKYIVEYVMRMSASYLVYVFKKCVRDNLNSRELVNNNFVSTMFLNYENKCSDVVYSYFGWQKRNPSEITPELSKTACATFAAHGWCRSGQKCVKSHDVDLVLDLDEQSLLKMEVKRKRKRERKHKGHGASVRHVKGPKLIDGASPAKHAKPSAAGAGRESLSSDASDADNNDDNNGGCGSSCRVTGELSDGDTQHTTDIDESSMTTSSPHSQINREKDGNLQPNLGGSPPDVLDKTKTSNSVKPGGGREGRGSGDCIASATKETEVLSSSHNVDPTKNTTAPCGHSSGFDAFMTGYIFSVAIAKIGDVDTKDSKLNLTSGKLGHWLNKVFLSNKDVPLSVYKSKFSQCSNFHKDKYRSLHSNLQT